MSIAASQDIRRPQGSTEKQNQGDARQMAAGTSSGAKDQGLAADWLAPPDHIPTLPMLLREASRRFGDQPIITLGERSLSYAEADRLSALIARRLLAAGVGKGTRIGILMPNTPEWILAYLAVTRIGAVAVLISTLYQQRELGWVIRHSDAQMLMAWGQYLSHDYASRLEGAAPGLAEQRAEEPLFLPDMPYLRRAIIWSDETPPWATEGAAFFAEESRFPMVDEALLAAVEEQVTPSDMAILMYTSGTTADPKGVAHAHGPLVRRTRIVPGARNHSPETRLLVQGPFCWAAGFVSVMSSLHAGATIILPASPKLEDFARAAVESDVTAISAQPALITRLRELLAEMGGEIGPGLATYLEGPRDEKGEPIASNRLSRGLGMTETVCMHSVERSGAMPADKPGAFGRAVRDIERAIRDPQTGADLPTGEKGELWLRGPGMMLGLYKKERNEVFDPAGYYCTGDICSIDEDGFLYYYGRSGEMIKTSGANVAPREVELALLRFPEIQEAGVFGLPKSGYDESVAAVIAFQTGHTLDIEDLRARLRADLAAFKVPKIIEVMNFDDLPRTGSNKLDKRRLKQMLVDREGAE